MDQALPHGAGWRPFTAQHGDDTYSGAYQVVGDEVHVVGDGESRRQKLDDSQNPLHAAERLLIDIHVDLPKPRSASEPKPSPWGGGRAAEAEQAPPDNRVGLALLAAFLALGVALALVPGRNPLAFGFVLVGWILAVMAHEFSHAFVAYLAGDTTVKAKGYLSFDPRRYGDLQTSLILPLIALAIGGIGFPGGAVYLRPDLMRSKAWRAAASLAGPGATLVVLLVLALILKVWTGFGADDALFPAIAMLAFLQAMALLLNLLPFPGLDGFNAIRPFLPRAWGPAIRKAEGFALIILLAALLLVPAIGASLFGAAADLTSALGIPRPAIGRGWDAFHFWQG